MHEKQYEQNLENEQWNIKFSHKPWFIIKCKDRCSNGFYIMLSIMQHIGLILREVTPMCRTGSWYYSLINISSTYKQSFRFPINQIYLIINIKCEQKSYSLKRTVKIETFVPFSNFHLCGLKITQQGNFLFEINKLKVYFLFQSLW